MTLNVFLRGTSDFKERIKKLKFNKIQEQFNSVQNIEQYNY